MNKSISKTEFKAHALAVLRDIEKTGEACIITNHGKPALEIRKLRSKDRTALEKLRGSVITYTNPTDPVAVGNWSEFHPTI